MPTTPYRRGEHTHTDATVLTLVCLADEEMWRAKKLAHQCGFKPVTAKRQLSWMVDVGLVLCHADTNSYLYEFAPGNFVIEEHGDVIHSLLRAVKTFRPEHYDMIFDLFDSWHLL